MVDGWIQTFTGRQFFPLAPRVEDIDIIDIAHALAMKCRYTGHTKRFYSVAEHSCLVAYALPDEFKLWGLMHDAAEAYLPDVVRPIKHMLTGFAEIEARVERAIFDKFGLVGEIPVEVHRVDAAILGDEKLALMGPEPASWDLPYAPLNVKIMCLPPPVAKELFLHRFKDLWKAPE